MSMRTHREGRYLLPSNILMTGAAILLTCTSSFAATENLPAADEAVAFKAVGYALKGKPWRVCDDPTLTLG